MSQRFGGPSNVTRPSNKIAPFADSLSQRRADLMTCCRSGLFRQNPPRRLIFSPSTLLVMPGDPELVPKPRKLIIFGEKKESVEIKILENTYIL